MSTLVQLREALGRATDELGTLVGNARGWRDKKFELEAIEEMIAQQEEVERRQAVLARPAGAGGNPKGWVGEGDPTKFRSLGEQLLAIRRASAGQVDPRLVRAPAGMGETDPSAGGFPVQVDFAETILQRVYDMGELAQRVFKLGISTNANGIKIPGIDETSRATGSRWGGVQTYWVGEGDPIPATRPKFRLIELDLKKLACAWYISDELMQDSSILSGIANQAFGEEITFMLEDSIVRGTGAGMPQGILSSNATITVPAEKGQATKTILYQNLLNMWARMWSKSRLNAVWFINQDAEPQLYAVNQVIGTAGVPVYLPPGGISEKPYATLFGRPVIPVEYCATLGTPSDVMLLDLSQYVLVDKNAMEQASSVHVQFLTDQMTFRLTYRIDGQSIWNSALTPYQGTNTKSPFIVLAQR